MADDIAHLPVVERLRIAVRERPVAQDALTSVEVRLRTEEDKLVAFSPHTATGMMYDFDYYYPQQAQQDDIFRTVGLEMVDVVMGGLSANCVVLGLTNTGKTHTLFGSRSELGLIHSTVHELFRRLQLQSDTHEYAVTLRYWEMSHDIVNDNLDFDSQVDAQPGDDTTTNVASAAVPGVTRTPGDPAAQSQQHPAGASYDGARGAATRTSCAIFRDGFGRLYVAHLREVAITSYDDFDRYLNAGNEQRLRRGYARAGRWHGFVQLFIETTDKAHGERCLLRTMTFVHTKGADRVGRRGVEGAALLQSCHINVSLTLLHAGVIHSLEYRDRRAHVIRTKEELHSLIRRSQSFFMECRFAQIMSQFICGHEASFVVGCVDPLHYGATIETLEQLQVMRRLSCACVPVFTPSAKGRLLRRLRSLEGRVGGAEVLAMVYGDHTGRPRTELEEELLRLRGKLESWDAGRSGSGGDADERARQHEEELRQRSRARLVQSADSSNSSGGGAGAVNFATHGDRNIIYLNAAKTATYEGQWAGGLFDGFGEHVQSNFRYRGEFRRGQREGEGTLFVRTTKSAPYRRVYQGEWLAGKRDGRGTQWYEDGEVYEGDFVADQRHGRGKLFLTNGDVVEGSFRGNACEGWAELRKANGDWFEGYWLKGKREGPGVWHYVARQQCLRGEWSNDVPCMGTLEDDADKLTCGPHSGFIPRVELQHYEQILAHERSKLNERRVRELGPIEAF